MRSKFDEQLADLNREMIEMGNGIIHSIKMAIEALISHDADKARQIMENDIEIDRQQKRIEGICFNLLIQQQPVARDLRTVTAAMKMVTDMERIGDQAEEIADRLSAVWGIPVDASYLVRSANTEAQKNLRNTDRLLNLNRALSVNGPAGRYRSVIVIDDIYTTGSTASACAKALKAAGVRKVYNAVLLTGRS